MNKIKNFFEKVVFGKSAAIAICFMCAFTVLCGFINIPLCIMGAAITVLYALLMCAITYFGRTGKDIDSDRGLITSITKDFLLKTDYAMILLDDKNDVMWFNASFSAILGKSAYGKNISEIISEGYGESTIEELKKGTAISCKIGTSSFEMLGYPTSSYSKNCCFIVFKCTDETEALKTKLLMKRPIVALLDIDNYAEATQFMGDNQRSALTLIGNALDSWNNELCGIIKEYEKNKYLIIFEEEKLESVLETKFSILDNIKDIEVEGVNVPFTASIGVARTDGDFYEKLSIARSALELALQRGGDQAVVKSDGSTEFFGGKMKSVQKRTKIRSRVIAEELESLIKNCGNVIIMGHKYADHDSIASCIGIAKLAKKAGKETHIIINIHDANLKPVFAMMRGKSEYLDLFTDAVAAQDYMRSDTLVIVCDVNNPKQFEAPDVFDAAKDIAIIDHHRKTGDYRTEPKIAYIEPSSSSASELVSEILEQSLEPGELSQLEADLLFSGLILDTKQFTKNTGVRTFGAAVYLRSEGANPIEAQKLFRTDIKDFIRESRFESDVKIHYDVIALSKYDGETESSDRISMAKAADRLLGVTSIKASFVMCVIDGNVCISARSDGTINVQLILEALGGGGHYDAAAAQLSGVTLEEAEKMLLDSCASYLSV